MLIEHHSWNGIGKGPPFSNMKDSLSSKLTGIICMVLILGVAHECSSQCLGVNSWTFVSTIVINIGHTLGTDAGTRTILNLKKEAVFLGQLYSARKDELLVHQLYDNVTRDDLTFIQNVTTNNQKFYTNLDILDRDNKLKVDVDLKASFMGGLIEVKGAAEYFTSREYFSDETSVVMTYHGQRHVKAIDGHHLPDSAHIYVCDLDQYEKDSMPTHVVTSIHIGFNAYLKFIRKVKNTESKTDIRGRLSILIKKIPSLKIEGEASLDLKEAENRLQETLDLEYYGDVILDNPPSTYEQAVATYHEFAKQLKTTENIMSFKISPLKSYCQGEAAVLNSLNNQEIDDISFMQQEFKKMTAKIEEFRQYYVPDRFPSYANIYNALEKSLNSYVSNINTELKKILPKIRGGNATAQLELTKMIGDYKTSPLNPTNIRAFLDPRKKEVETLQFIFEESRKIGGKITIDLGSSGDGNTCLIGNSFSVVFRLKVLPVLEKDEENVAQQYLKTKPGDWNEADKWFNSLESVGAMGAVFRDFRDFVKMNLNEDVCYLVKLEPLVNHADPRPARLDALGSKGVTLFENFSPPKNVIVKKVLNGWKTIHIKVEFSEHKYTTRLEYKYTNISNINDTGVEESIEIKPFQTEATISLNERYVEINHLYEFAFTLRTDWGKGPTNNEIKFTTLPSKPPSKLMASHVSSSSATISWSQPKIESGVKLLGYKYRYGFVGEDLDSFTPIFIDSKNFHQDNLEPVTKYKVQVRCVWSAHFEDQIVTSLEEDLWTNTTFITLPLTPDPPKVSGQTESTIDLFWLPITRASYKADSYEIKYHRRGNDGELALQRTTYTEAITLTGLAAGENYHVYIKTRAEDVESEWSTPIEATTNERTSTQLEKLKLDIGIKAISDQISDVNNNLTEIKSEMNVNRKKINKSKIDLGKEMTNLESALSIFVLHGTEKKWTNVTFNPHYGTQTVTHHYLIFNTYFTQRAAKDICSKFGMQLVAVNNQKEDDKIVEYLRENPAYIEYAWLGAERNLSSNKWSWSKPGSPKLKYTNWENSDQPKVDENCAAIRVSNGKWTYKDCNTYYCAVCKYTTHYYSYITFPFRAAG